MSLTEKHQAGEPETERVGIYEFVNYMIHFVDVALFEALHSTSVIVISRRTSASFWLGICIRYSVVNVASHLTPPIVHSDSLSANHANQVLELHSQAFEIKNETVCNELPYGHSHFLKSTLSSTAAFSLFDNCPLCHCSGIPLKQ